MARSFLCMSSTVCFVLSCSNIFSFPRAPVAVAVATMSTAEMLAAGMKGKGFAVLHTYMDHLWWVKLFPWFSPFNLRVILIEIKLEHPCYSDIRKSCSIKKWTLYNFYLKMVNCACLNQIRVALHLYSTSLLSFKLRFMGGTQSLWRKVS